jgi:ankyrin repeat protein
MTDGTSTPRCNAVQSGYGYQFAYAELFLAGGANINEKDGHGKTPLGMSMEYKRYEVAAFLRKRGGKE